MPVAPAASSSQDRAATGVGQGLDGFDEYHFGRDAGAGKVIQRAVVWGGGGVTSRFARSPGNPRDRHLTAEIAG